MDGKLVAALVIAVIGVGTGIAGIVIANDAKDQNAKTDAALKAAIASENRGVAQQEAQAEKGLNELGQKIEGEVASAEKQIEAEGQKSAGQLGALQASVNTLQKQLSAFEANQRTTNQKLNARITALAQRVNAMGG